MKFVFKIYPWERISSYRNGVSQRGYVLGGFFFLMLKRLKYLTYIAINQATIHILHEAVDMRHNDQTLPPSELRTLSILSLTRSCWP